MLPNGAKQLFAFFAAARRSRALENSQDLVFAHDQKLFAIDFDFGSAVLSEQNAVASFNVQSLPGTVILVFALTYGHSFTLLELVLGRVGDVDAPAPLLALFDSADNHTVMKRPDVRCHNAASPFSFREKF